MANVTFSEKHSLISSLGMFNKSFVHSKRIQNLVPKTPRIIRKIVLAGSGTSADDHVQEIKKYPTLLPFDNDQILESKQAKMPLQTKLLNLTIDGINESDLESLRTKLEQVDGVIDVWIGPFVEGGIRGGIVTVNVQKKENVPSPAIVKQIQELDQQLLVLPYKYNTWTWRGHNIKYGVAGCGKPIILVHGFGGNAGHFAKLIPYLTDNYRVYAVDLLGFGASDKPQDANYGPELWAELLCDFANEFADEGVVLVGNSIGSLTSLTAAADCEDLIRGIVLLNCAGAMNRKGLMDENILIRLLSPIFIAIEYLLQRPKIANFLFDRFRRKENIKQILQQQAYRNRESVTDQLVDILYQPSTDPGATDVFVKVFTGEPGPRPEALMEKISSPLLVLWGDKDIWTPFNGPVANFFKRLASERDNVAVFPLSDVGHCPHDDRPELAASYILPFLEKYVDKV